MDKKFIVACCLVFLRKQSGYKIAAVIEYIGYSRAHYYQVEQGNANIDIGVIFKLLELYGMDTIEFFRLVTEVSELSNPSMTVNDIEQLIERKFKFRVQVRFVKRTLFAS